MKEEMGVMLRIAPLLMVFGLFACNQGEEKLIERAKIEGKAQAEADLKVQVENMQVLLDRAREEGRVAAESGLAVNNGNLARRSAEMEADLEGRQRFFQAVAGTYEGVLQTDRADFRIRLTLVSSVPPYNAGRVRTLEEIAHDLTGLSFNVQVLQWNPKNMLSAVGCRVQNVRPDLVNGMIHISSENCPNFYSLALNNGAEPNSRSDEVATLARSGGLASVPELQGEVHPTTNANVFRFTASKAR